MSWALVNGLTINTLNVIDEFTRECLVIEVDRSIDAGHVVGVLDRPGAERGVAPVLVRFDNGGEVVAHTFANSCRCNGTDNVFIDPGSPWQNAASTRSTLQFGDSSAVGISPVCSEFA